MKTFCPSTHLFRCFPLNYIEGAEPLLDDQNVYYETISMLLL